jgi:Domain of unknown function (DUF1906)
MSRSLRFATLAVLIGGWAMSASVAWAHGVNKLVSYRGYRIRVPVSWPVYDLSSHPTVCVRFDRHAVYLGHPSADQRCPAHAVGRTEAILLEPVVARGARAAGASTSQLPLQTSMSAQPRQGSAAEVAIPRRGVRVTATWANDRRVIERALGVRSIAGTRSRAAADSRGVDARALGGGVSAHAAAVNKGLGFDACSAPSTAKMSAWRSSPYQAVGVYLGGTNMACSQSNLSSGWVTGEVAAGWHLIPTYVGLQAPGACGCASIQASHASAEGTAAASDAVSRAQAVGIGKGNPIYFDMEAYSPGRTNTSSVLAFLSAWTTALHGDGYVSGVYSSAASGMRDLVAAQGSSFKEPDDIWIANWNGTQSTSDPYVPSHDWADHQRLHQYQGAHDATYGGVTLNIDSDYLDGSTVGSGSALPPPFPDGTFVWPSGTLATYRIAGGAPLFVSNWAAFGGPQPFTAISQQQFNALAPVPSNGTFLVTSTGRIFRVAGGTPFAIGSWSVFGGPRPSVTVDEWDIDNMSNPAAHLRARPADGTVVEGLPSHSYWSFIGGARAPTRASSAAVTVDDTGLAVFPRLPPSTGGTSFGKSVRCVVPSLGHMTLVKATRALQRAHCNLGKVHRPPHVSRHRVLHVTKQSARAQSRHAASYAVNLTLG